MLADFFWQITASEKFSVPYKSVDNDLPATGAETRTLFDETTGTLLKKVITFWFEDGSERTFLEMTQKISNESPYPLKT